MDSDESIVPIGLDLKPLAPFVQTDNPLGEWYVSRIRRLFYQEYCSLVVSLLPGGGQPLSALKN